MVVGEGFPIGKLTDTERRVEPAYLGGQLVHILRIGTDDDQRAPFGAKRSS